MITKKISQEAAWSLIKDALGKYFIVIPTDYSTVYTELSDVPKDIEGVILYKEHYKLFLIEFKKDGEIVLSKGDPHELTGKLKEFYDIRYEVVTGAYSSPNGEKTKYNDHVYVDLGLPSGLMWAEADAGRYAWAEAVGKESFSRSNARKRTKFADVKGDSKMDAARVRWGGKWRTPTPEDFQELIDNCTWQWRGRGYLLTGPNGKQIYLSACGYNESAWGPLGKGHDGYFWTCSSKEGEDNAVCLFFNKSERKLNWQESYMGMCIRPVFNEAEAEPVSGSGESGPAVKNPEEYNGKTVRENGVLYEKFIFSGDKHWRTGNRATAQRRIKTGDFVILKFLGAMEEKVRVREWNPVWEMDETITVMAENFYYEVVVNEKQAYYGKLANKRYIKESDTMGGGVTISVTRSSLTENEVYRALSEYKAWLSDGAKENNYWHGLYKKTEFPEKIVYGMPGEENVAPVAEATWQNDDIIEEGEGIFSCGGIRYEVVKDYKYDENDKRKTITSLKVLPLKGSCYSGSVCIPEEVKYHRKKLAVTRVDSEAFDNCPELKEIELSRTVTSFPCIRGSHGLERITVAEGNRNYISVEGVLYGHEPSYRRREGEYSHLQSYPHARGESFTVPDFVESIAAGAFEGCTKLKTIALSNKIDRIGNNTFKDCVNLESIEWGTGVLYICSGAFENCTSLRGLEFPSSVMSVDSNAFQGCINIVKVTFQKGRYFNLNSLPADQFPWGQGDFIVNGVQYRTGYHEATLEVINLNKEDLENFKDASVETLCIPSKVEHNGFVYEVTDCRCSFEQFPSLKRLEIPYTVRKLAINGIKTLQEVIVDEQNHGYSSLDGILYDRGGTTLLGVPRMCPITTFSVPQSVEIIGVEACRGNKFIEKLLIHDGVKKIDKKAFADCASLHDVTLGENVKHIGPESFAYTAIERIVLPAKTRFTNHETWDGNTAFYGSKLKEYVLDGENDLYTTIDGVLYIKTQCGLRLRSLPSAFAGHLQIPYGVYQINKMACMGCSELTSVFVPESVKDICDDAFGDCTKLENIEFDGKIDSIGMFCFHNCVSLKEIDCIGVKKIDDSAFSGIKGLKLNLPYALEKERYKFEK